MFVGGLNWETTDGKLFLLYIHSLLHFRIVHLYSSISRNIDYVYIYVIYLIFDIKIILFLLKNPIPNKRIFA